MANGVSHTITRDEYLEFKNDVNRRFDQVDKRLDQVENRLEQGFSEIRREMSILRNWMLGLMLSLTTAAIGASGALFYNVIQ